MKVEASARDVRLAQDDQRKHRRQNFMSDTQGNLKMYIMFTSSIQGIFDGLVV